MIDAKIEDRFTSLENCQPLELANYSGIYFLCQGSMVVYVGKAKNIARRIIAHCGNKDFNTVMVLRVPEELLHSVEMHWIRRLRPSLNVGAGRKAPAGRREPVTLRLAPKLRQHLAAKAKAEKCSLTELMEKLLKTALEDENDVKSELNPRKQVRKKPKEEDHERNDRYRFINRD